MTRRGNRGVAAGIASSHVASDGRTEAAGARHPFVIELIGTPGSGKTTLALRLVSMLRSRGIPAETIVSASRGHVERTRLGRLIDVLPWARPRRLLLWWAFYALATAHTLRFVKRHPALARHVVRSQLARDLKIRRRAHTFYWFLQLAGRYDFLVGTSRAGDVLVVDDGFLHRALSLHASHRERPSAEVVHRYVDLLPRPDVAVHAVAPAEVCERRVHERGVWPHSKKLTRAEIAQSLDNAELAADLAVARARRHGWTVVGVDNSGGSLDRVESDLSPVVARCLAGVAPCRPAEDRN